METVTQSRVRKNPAPQLSARKSPATHHTFAVLLTRLAKVDDTPGLILLQVDSGTGEPLTRIGALTDAALRGRLSHFDLHSANEVATIRQALRNEAGRTILYESWPSLEGCLQFWYSFFGSQIRPVEWTCEKCATLNREDVGSSAGEPFSRACLCGQVLVTTIGRR
jgi:hypothetical protein